MKLLDGKLYDPTTAVNKVTTGLLAMTAIDTTNLRLTVTVPKSGKILCRMGAAVHGATTCPQIMLGVLEGSTLRGRRSPMVGGGNLAATTLFAVETEFMITGLTPGASFVADAAYGVETVVASTGLKYGGPNNTTANDNFGGFQFELWDPDPYTVDSEGNIDANVEEWNTVDVSNLPSNWHSLAVDASGRVTVGSIADGAITAAAVATGAIDADAIADNAIDAGAIATGAITSAKFAAGAIDATAIATDAIGANEFSQAAADKVWSTAARLLTAGTNIVLAKGTGITGFTDLSAAQVNAEVDTAIADVGLTTTITGRIDVATSTRLASAGYTAPPSAAAVRAEIDTNSTKLDVAVSTRLAAADYVVPDNAGVAAIQAKTDSLTFTVAGKLDVNVLVVNGVTIGGAGTAGDPWGPA